MGKIVQKLLSFFFLSLFLQMTEENWSEDPVQTQVAEIPEIKLFGKWSADDVQIGDISLQVS